MLKAEWHNKNKSIDDYNEYIPSESNRIAL